MNELNFNSQICTTKEQSERLLKLGLKPETADMVLIKELAYDEVAHCTYDADTYMIRPIDYLEGERHRGHIPAWSLHRLVQMMPLYLHFDDYVDTKYYLTLRPCCLTKVLYKQDSGCWMYGSESSNLFDAIIDVIEYLIFGNHFNKEYLKQ